MPLRELFMPLRELFDASMIHSPTPYLCKLCGASSCRLCYDLSATNFTLGEEVVCGLDHSVYDPDTCTSPVLASELQELPLGLWQERIDEGHPASPNPPTAGP